MTAISRSLRSPRLVGMTPSAVAVLGRARRAFFIRSAAELYYPPIVRRSWGLWLILLFGAVARVLYFLTFRAFDPYYAVPIMDAARYDRWARAIAAGRSF